MNINTTHDLSKAISHLFSEGNLEKIRVEARDEHLLLKDQAEYFSHAVAYGLQEIINTGMKSMDLYILKGYTKKWLATNGFFEYIEDLDYVWG